MAYSNPVMDLRCWTLHGDWKSFGANLRSFPCCSIPTWTHLPTSMQQYIWRMIQRDGKRRQAVRRLGNCMKLYEIVTLLQIPETMSNFKCTKIKTPLTGAPVDAKERGRLKPLSTIRIAHLSFWPFAWWYSAMKFRACQHVFQNWSNDISPRWTHFWNSRGKGVWWTFCLAVRVWPFEAFNSVAVQFPWRCLNGLT